MRSQSLRLADALVPRPASALADLLAGSEASVLTAQGPVSGTILARTLGITPRALRYYEEAGLLTPSRITSGSRYYDREDVARALVIVRLRELDLPVGDIRDLLVGAGGAGDVRGRLTACGRELRRRLDLIARLEEALVAAHPMRG